MATKAELEEQAKAAGYDTEGLTKEELESLLGDADEIHRVGMQGQSEPHYPQELRHAKLESEAG